MHCKHTDSHTHRHAHPDKQTQAHRHTGSHARTQIQHTQAHTDTHRYTDTQTHTHTHTNVRVLQPRGHQGKFQKLTITGTRSLTKTGVKVAPSIRTTAKIMVATALVSSGRGERMREGMEGGGGEKGKRMRR